MAGGLELAAGGWMLSQVAVLLLAQSFCVLPDGGALAFEGKVVGGDCRVVGEKFSGVILMGDDDAPALRGLRAPKALDSWMSMRAQSFFVETETVVLLGERTRLARFSGPHVDSAFAGEALEVSLARDFRGRRHVLFVAVHRREGRDAARRWLEGLQLVSAPRPDAQ